MGSYCEEEQKGIALLYLQVEWFLRVKQAIILTNQIEYKSVFNGGIYMKYINSFALNGYWSASTD